MNRVFLSFLGLGTFKKEKGRYEYDPAVYKLKGRKSKETKFVQVAEIEILGADKFDKVIVIATQKSSDFHFDNLKSQLENRGVTNILPIIIGEDMSPEGQWDWLEQILNIIEPGDQLTVDLTHGYRSIPIVFSAAINFVQKAKNVSLRSVYYGAFDKARELGYAPIVDMKDFYIINEWAEAVSRLVEDADARKMAEVSDRTAEFQAGELNDKELIRAFEDLTNTIRNVDIHRVANKANTAINLIKEKERSASVTGKILLRLVIDKFASLATGEPPSGRYDKAYFLLQLEIIKLLLEHKLFMQAYTVMREFIASVGLIEIKKAKTDTSEGRKQRRKGDVFFNMFQFHEDGWNFSEEAEVIVQKIMPYYEKLKRLGIEPILRSFAKDLAEYRNGFDHAWTRKPEAPNDLEEKGQIFFEKLGEVVTLLDKNRILH